MKARCAAMLVGALVLCACSAAIDPGPVEPRPPASAESGAATSEAAPGRSVGGDRDPQGCIPSAGYQWCERTGRCERSWELAQQEGFSLDADGFSAFCASGRDAAVAPATPG